jgi:hypothetical protein
LDLPDRIFTNRSVPDFLLTGPAEGRTVDATLLSGPSGAHPVFDGFAQLTGADAR